MREFIFHVVGRHTHPNEGNYCAYLRRDNWNDYGYKTSYQLIIFDDQGVKYELGDVKIGQTGMVSFVQDPNGNNSTQLEESFSSLPVGYFSIGLSENYYETLYSFVPEFRNLFLEGLKDCASDLDRFERFKNEDVMQTSLLRGISDLEIQCRFHRIITGNATLSEYDFTYTFPESGNADNPPPSIDFSVRPQSTPPTNVHALIGSNGVGKTYALVNMSRSLLLTGEDHESGELLFTGYDETGHFTRLITVSFSAFDDFDFSDITNPSNQFRQIGLHRFDGGGVRSAKTLEELSDNFCTALDRCRTGPRKDRWVAAITTLSTQRLFAELQFEELVHLDADEWRNIATERFQRLSSGHAIILLTITQLVEYVDERSLVLLDEPEGHLHPPLLSAFIRSLSDLLINRNGVAIVSTHSPVVLQEVPASCVWLLERSGDTASVDRPEKETFGADVGSLTHAVFKHEVTRTGFYQMLTDAVATKTYDAVMAEFGNQLGNEAKAIVRCLIAERDANRDGAA